MHAWPKTSVGAVMWLAAFAVAPGCAEAGPAGSVDFGQPQPQGNGGTTHAGVDGGGGVSLGGGSDVADGGSGVDPGTPGDDASTSGPGPGTDAGARSDASTPVDSGGGTVGVDAARPVDAAPPPPPVVDSGDPLAAARTQCVQIINQYRATLSPPSPPLTEATSAKETCVDQQAQKDYQADTAHSAFGQCSEFAQDECPGWPGPPSSINTDCLAQMWAEGPPPSGQDNHWLNMSNAKYTKVACGFYQTPSGDWWATQDFW